MLTHRGSGDRIEVLAAANRTSGVATTDDGWTGIPENTVLSGALYTLRITGEYEVPKVSSTAKGDNYSITVSSSVLKRQTSTTVASGDRMLGKVSRMDSEKGVPSGKVWIILGNWAMTF